jgi:hypothetical protein
MKPVSSGIISSSNDRHHGFDGRSSDALARPVASRGGGFTPAGLSPAAHRPMAGKQMTRCNIEQTRKFGQRFMHPGRSRLVHTQRPGVSGLYRDRESLTRYPDLGRASPRVSLPASRPSGHVFLHGDLHAPPIRRIVPGRQAQRTLDDIRGRRWPIGRLMMRRQPQWPRLQGC